MPNLARFVQREHGTTHGDVTFAGDRARITDSLGHIVAAWTTGGVLTHVPQGTGYILEIDRGGIIERIDLSIGIAVSAMGQSNMKQWFREGGVIAAAPGTFGIEQDGTVGQTVGLAARIYTAVIAEVTGAPVAIINSSVGATKLTGGSGDLYWLDEAEGSVYDSAKRDLVFVGGSVEVALWAQGESDGSAENREAFRAGLYELFSRFQRDFGDPLIVIQELAPRMLADGTLDYTTRASRVEDQNAVAADLGNVIIGAHTGDATLMDSSHLDSISRAGAALRMAVATLESWGHTGVARYLTAGNSGETIAGGETIDFITGGTGTDRLSGGLGRDEIKGGGGADQVDGGKGDDILRGQAGSDIIVGGDGNDMIDGGSEADQLSGGAGADEIWGAAGDDIINGGAGGNSLWGDGGDDLLIAGLHDERLRGGEGFDTVSYTGASTGVAVYLAEAGRQDTGGSGHDTLDSLEGIIGSRHDDVLFGNQEANAIRGGEGNDTIAGGAGNDVLRGERGDDTVTYRAAGAGVRVDLAITAAQDTIGDGLDLISSFSNLTGSQFADHLFGHGGNNVIVGGDGIDTLDGRDGNDRLAGGNGSDFLTGGGGADTFVFAVGESGKDTVTDLEARDIIELLGSGLTTVTRVVGFSGVAGEYVLTFASGQTTLVLDINGDRIADWSVRLNGDLTAVAFDFVV